MAKLWGVAVAQLMQNKISVLAIWRLLGAIKKYFKLLQMLGWENVESDSMNMLYLMER